LVPDPKLIAIGNPPVYDQPADLAPANTAAMMAARDQALFAETLFALKKALKRKAYGEFLDPSTYRDGRS